MVEWYLYSGKVFLFGKSKSIEDIVSACVVLSLFVKLFYSSELIVTILIRKDSLPVLSRIELNKKKKQCLIQIRQPLF